MRVHSAVLDPRPRSRAPFVAVLLAAGLALGVAGLPATPVQPVASVAQVDPEAALFVNRIAIPTAAISEGRVRARLRAEGWEPGDPLPDRMPRKLGAAM